MLQKVGMFLIALFICVCSRAQTVDSSQLVKYDRKFQFKKGIYLDFESFKANDPIAITNIISKYNSNESDFFKKVISEERFIYVSKIGDTISIISQSIWGYSDDDGIYFLPKKHITEISNGHYVSIQNKIVPQKLFLIGRMSAFYEIDETVVYIPGVVTTNGVNQPENITKQKLISFIVDYDSGKVYLFNLEEFEEKIKKEDPELYKEYKKVHVHKNSRVWVLISMYNDKYPIYFPLRR